jgi:hypothetical protein
MVTRNTVEVAPSFDDELEDDESVRGSVGLKDDEILAILKNEISSADGSSMTSELQENRRQALRYYMGEPYGDETEGRSQVVTTEFRDTIESLLPQLMKIFMSSDTVVQFRPETPKDEEAAQQATDYVNHIFMVDNPGFVILYTMIKDALLHKNGIVKIFWDKSETVTTETYQSLTEMEKLAVLQDPEVEPLELSHYSTTTPLGEMYVCDLKVRRVRSRGRAKVVAVPPEEFLLTRHSDSIQNSRFCAHRCRKTVSDLVALGVPKEKAESFSSNSIDGEFSQERQERFKAEGGMYPLSDSGDKATRYVWLYECYVLLDTDGDGIAERWKILLAGDQYELISKEEWEGDWPFESISPILMPHKFYGLSIFDLVKQWQRIQSTLVRQFLDNVYSINNNRVVVNADRVNLDDLLTNRPNAIVRTMGPPGEALMPLQPQPIGNTLIPSLEFFNSMREKATGVTSYNQGLDANSLNKTASGISQIMSAAQERILLVARIFAETGIAGMFQQILKLTVKYQDQKRTIQLRGKWVDIDPAAWNAEMKATTDVALGTNNRDQMLLHLQTLLGVQKEAMMGGMGLVTPKNLYNTLAKLVENTGLKHVELFFTDPDQVPPQEPQPSEAEIEAKTKMQIESGKAQTQAHLKELELKHAAQEKMVSANVEMARVAQDAKNQEAERENKLRIAREQNLTTLATSQLSLQQKVQSDKLNSTAVKEGKKKPTRVDVQRDPVTREVTGIIPVYEEIMETAQPELEVGRDLTPLAEGMLEDDKS